MCFDFIPNIVSNNVIVVEGLHAEPQAVTMLVESQVSSERTTIHQVAVDIFHLAPKWWKLTWSVEAGLFKRSLVKQPF